MFLFRVRPGSPFRFIFYPEIILTAVFNFIEQGVRPLIKRGIVVLPAAYGYTDADSRSRVSGRPAPGLQ